MGGAGPRRRSRDTPAGSPASAGAGASCSGRCIGVKTSNGAAGGGVGPADRHPGHHRNVVRSVPSPPAAGLGAVPRSERSGRRARGEGPAERRLPAAAGPRRCGLPRSARRRADDEPNGPFDAPLVGRASGSAAAAGLPFDARQSLPTAGVAGRLTAPVAFCGDGAAVPAAKAPALDPVPAHAPPALTPAGSTYPAAPAGSLDAGGAVARRPDARRPGAAGRQRGRAVLDDEHPRDERHRRGAAVRATAAASR